MSYILQTLSLEKTIKEKTIISNFDMHIRKGEIYGFLGPNGAGKTSVMKMIMNFWKPTGGMIEVFGDKLMPTSYEVLGKMGGIIEYPVFYDYLSGEDNLKLHCKYIGYDNYQGIENALDLLGLREIAKSPVEQYSLGIKQRLAIARVIISRPELLILDEPMNGLDPISMKQIRSLFYMLKKELGVTIMISTHILSEIEDIVDMIGIINRGSMVKEISINEVTQMQATYIEIGIRDMRKAIQTLDNILPRDSWRVVDKNRLRVYSEMYTLQEIFRELILQENEVISIVKKSNNLEDYFMHIIGECEKND